MATPTYVARRMGDQYELEPQQTATAPAAPGTNSWTPWIGGGLIVLGLARRGFSGAILCAAGGAVLYHIANQGAPAGETSSDAYNPMPPLETTASPSYPRETERTEQLPEDKVEEESMESFPASDAPSSSVSRTL